MGTIECQIDLNQVLFFSHCVLPILHVPEYNVLRVDGKQISTGRFRTVPPGVRFPVVSVVYPWSEGIVSGRGMKIMNTCHSYFINIAPTVLLNHGAVRDHPPPVSSSLPNNTHFAGSKVEGMRKGRDTVYGAAGI